MSAGIDWLETLFGLLPLPLLEVWGRLAYIVGLALAVCAFGGFTFRPGGRWGIGREHQAWDAKAVQSIPVTFILVIGTGCLGSFIVLVPEAQTLESLKDLMVFVCIVLFGYPALLAMPFAYGLSDLIEGVPPEYLLDWLPGYFINPACFWMAYQLFGKNPDFRRARTWGWFLLFVLLFMSIEPVLWGCICADKFTPEISFGSITPALFFTTGITWVMAPFVMLGAFPLARKFGMFWAEIPGHVKERPLRRKEWVWEAGAGGASPEMTSVTEGWPIRMVLLTPFIALVLLMVGATAYVTLRSAADDGHKLVMRLHQEISNNISLHLNEHLARAPGAAAAVNTDEISTMLKGLPVAQNGFAVIIKSAGGIIASSASNDNPIVTKAIAHLHQTSASSVQLKEGFQFHFDHVIKKPLTRQIWLACATAYQDQRGAHPGWMVLTLMPESYYLAGVHAGNSRSALVFALALLLSLAVAALLAAMVTKQLRRIAQATQSLAHGNLDQRAPGSRMEELDILARSFNDMAASLKKSFDHLNGEIELREKTEDALREKQTQLLLAMDIAKLAHWEFDVVKNIVIADEHIFQLLGTTSGQQGGLAMSPEEYIRRFVHPEDAGIVANEVAVGLASTDPNFASQFEHRIIREDGSERVMLVRARIIMDATGRTDKILGTNQDITEQKQAELRIRHLNRIYAVLSAINKTIVHEKDSQTMLAAACQIAVEKGGFRMAWIGMFDAIAQKILPVASAGVVEGYMELINIDLHDQARCSGPAGRCFLTAAHVASGDMEHDPLQAAWREAALQRGYRSSASFPLKVNGKVSGVFTLYSDKIGFFSAEEMLLLDELAMDIGFALEVGEGEAKRRQAEQELRWRTAFFEAQVHSAIDGILVVDSTGKKLLQNRRMNELWKIPPPITDDPDDSKQVQFVLGRVREPQAFAEKIAHLNAHPDESSTDVIEQLDGTTLERHSAPVRGSDGRYYGRVWTFHDITERKKLEQQFLRAQRMESIGTLASGVAHDLNNILAPIMMSVAVLRMNIPEEKRANLFDTIETSAARGAQIVKQVLTFGRGLDGEKHPMQVGMLIQEMEQMIRSTFPKDIALECVSGPHLWLVLGDATQIHQVLLNLCVNARDAMPGGGTLRLSATNLDIDVSYASMMPEITPGPHLLLEVSDTGSGIPPEILERIFDPFFTTKGVGKGTGLGLSTVHGIVKSHGGLLKVASKAGKGTTFQVYLPAAPDQAAVAGADSLAPPPIGHGELVLVVDDEPAITNAAGSVLEANGYRVLLANDGAEALAVFSQNMHEVAVVLTDVMMPVMNGVLLLRTLRKMSPGLPVIGSSGLAETAHLGQLKELHVESILRKPYNAATLLRTIQAVLHPNP